MDVDVRPGGRMRFFRHGRWIQRAHCVVFLGLALSQLHATVRQGGGASGAGQRHGGGQISRFASQHACRPIDLLNAIAASRLDQVGGVIS